MRKSAEDNSKGGKAQLTAQFECGAYILCMDNKTPKQRERSERREIAEMRNEDLVAEIKRLTDASGSQDQRRLQRLKDQLFEKNKEAILKTARYYNRGRRVTEDETQNAYLSLFEAVEKYDESKGATFATFLGFYVQSAIQEQHAFSHPRQSQSMYARARGKLNNPENHGRDAVNRAEAQLWSDKPFDEKCSETANENIPERICDRVILKKWWKSLTEREQETAELLVAKGNQRKASKELDISERRCGQIRAEMRNKFAELGGELITIPGILALIGRRIGRVRIGLAKFATLRARAGGLQQLGEIALTWFILNSLTIVAVSKFILGVDLAFLLAAIAMKPVERALAKWDAQTIEAMEARIAKREVLEEAA